MSGLEPVHGRMGEVFSDPRFIGVDIGADRPESGPGICLFASGLWTTGNELDGDMIFDAFNAWAKEALERGHYVNPRTCPSSSTEDWLWPYSNSLIIDLAGARPDGFGLSIGFFSRGPAPYDLKIYAGDPLIFVAKDDQSNVCFEPIPE